MKITRFVILFVLMVLLLAPGPAWAAKESKAAAGEAADSGAKVVCEGEAGRGLGYEPCPPGEECPATFGPIITDTAVPIDKGKFAVQPTFGYSFVVNSLTQNWRRITAGGNFQSFSMQWKLTYGLWNNLETFVVVPYVHNWAGDVNVPGPNGETSANSGGLGDVNWTLKYRLVEETETLPTVSAVFTTSFPTGRFRNPNPAKLGQDVIGNGSYVFTTGLNLSKYIKPFIFYANVWYSMQTAFTTRGEWDEELGKSLKGRIYPRDFVTVNLAAEYIITPKWVALMEVVSTWDGGRLFGHKSNVQPAALLSVVPGIEFMATEKLAFALGCQVDLFGKNNDAAITPLFSFVYCF